MSVLSGWGDALFASQQLAPLSQLCVAALGSVEFGSLDDGMTNLESSCTSKRFDHFTGPRQGMGWINIRRFTPWHDLTTLGIVSEFAKQVYVAKCFRTTDFKWFEVYTPSYTVFYMTMPCYAIMLHCLYFYELIIFLLKQLVGVSTFEAWSAEARASIFAAASHLTNRRSIWSWCGSVGTASCWSISSVAKDWLLICYWSNCRTSTIFYCYWITLCDGFAILNIQGHERPNLQCVLSDGGKKLGFWCPSDDGDMKWQAA